MATNKGERGERVITVLHLKNSLQSMILFYQNVEQYNTTITTDWSLSIIVLDNKSLPSELMTPPNNIEFCSLDLEGVWFPGKIWESQKE